MASNRKSTSTPVNAAQAAKQAQSPATTQQAVAHEVAKPVAANPSRCSAMRKAREGKPERQCRQAELVPGHTTCVWHTPKAQRPEGWAPTQGLAGAVFAERAAKQAAKQAKLREQAKARATMRVVSKPGPAPKPAQDPAMLALLQALVGAVLADSPEAKQAAKAKLTPFLAA